MRKKVLLGLLVTVFSVDVYGGIWSRWWKGPSFSTLRDLSYQARVTVEHPQMDNKNFMHPNYSSFYQSRSHNFLKRTWRNVKNWLPNKKAATWTPSDFESTLKAVIEKRKANLYYGKFIQKFTPPKGSHFVMWGSLYGAYHSFVRGLKELKRQGVISNDLKIIKPNYYFVFNGNVVDFSPHSMETLTAVLLLMKNNPNSVFYIKGPHESKRLWYKHGLKEELQGKIKKTRQFVAQERLVEEFFDTLPLALFLRKKNGVITRFVQISNGDELHRWGGESLFREFLYAPDYGKTQIFKLNKKFGADLAAGNIFDLYINADDGSHTLAGEKGLRKKSIEAGVPVWSLFCGQTRTHRAMSEFFYDSFVIFSINDVFSRSTLSLYSRDTRNNNKNKGFVKTTYLSFPKGSLNLKH